MALPLGMSAELAAVAAGVLAVGASFAAGIIGLAAFKLMRHAIDGTTPAGVRRADAIARGEWGKYEERGYLKARGEWNGAKNARTRSEVNASPDVWNPAPTGHSPGDDPNDSRSYPGFHHGPDGERLHDDPHDDHPYH